MSRFLNQSSSNATLSRLDIDVRLVWSVRRFGDVGDIHCRSEAAVKPHRGDDREIEDEFSIPLSSTKTCISLDLVVTSFRSLQIDYSHTPNQFIEEQAASPVDIGQPHC